MHYLKSYKKLLYIFYFVDGNSSFKEKDAFINNQVEKMCLGI